MTLLRALAVAGGQGALSDLSEVMLFRIGTNGERATVTYDVDKDSPRRSVRPYGAKRRPDRREAKQIPNRL